MASQAPRYQIVERYLVRDGRDAICGSRTMVYLSAFTLGWARVVARRLNAQMGLESYDESFLFIRDCGDPSAPPVELSIWPDPVPCIFLNDESIPF